MVDSMSATTPSARIVELDVLRGVAIAGVVWVHTSWDGVVALLAGGGNVHPLVSSHVASLFCVPMFLAVAVATLVVRARDAGQDAGAALAFWRKRFGRLLPAYALWSVLSLAAAGVVHPAAVVNAIWFGTADAQFYFIPLLAQVLLVWPLVARVVAAVTDDESLPQPLVAALVAGVSWAVSVAAWRASAAAWPHGSAFPWATLWAVHLGAGLLLGLNFSRLAALARSNALIAAAYAAVFVTFVWAMATTRVGYGFSQSADTIAVAATALQQPHAAYAWALMALVVVAVFRVTANDWRKSMPPVTTLAALGRASYGVFLTHRLIEAAVRGRVLPHLPGWGTTAPATLAWSFVEWLVVLVAAYALTRALAVRWV